MTDRELSPNYRIQAGNGNKGGPTKRGSGLLLPVLEHRRASELHRKTRVVIPPYQVVLVG